MIKAECAVVWADTTRAPRPGEVDGKAYHFVTKTAFENLVKEEGFAEYTTSYDT
jgi:guanylate kinase